MIAAPFELSCNLEVIQQPYLRATEKVQELFQLLLRCSQLWGGVKYLFNHRV